MEQKKIVIKINVILNNNNNRYRSKCEAQPQQYMFIQFRKIYPMCAVESISFIHYENEWTLIFINFSCHSNSQRIIRENFLLFPLMRSHYPRCLWSVSQPKNLAQRNITLKFYPLVFTSSLFLLKFPKNKKSMKTYIVLRPRQNHVAICMDRTKI